MDDRTRTLVSRARGADREAVNELFARYREPLRRGLRKMLGERYRTLVADSEDATHDAILSALADLDEFDYRGEGSFLAWLLRRAECEALNKLRDRNAQKRTPQGRKVVGLDDAGDVRGGEPSVSAQASDRDMLARVQACLDDLPPRERDVVILRRFMELDTESVRVEMDLPSASAVRGLLARAQTRLTGLLARPNS